MNSFTETVWEIVVDSPELLTKLTAQMSREFKPFLTEEQAFKTNVYDIERRMQDDIEKWFEWLPDSPINSIAGELALQAMKEVDWSRIALLVRERASLEKLSGLS